VDPLTRTLDECADVCEETLDAYLRPLEAPRDSAFARALIYAIAGMRVAASRTSASAPVREAALAVARDLALDAAGACREHGFDELLLRCSSACDDAAALCASGLVEVGLRLGEPPPGQLERPQHL
jgi:hypothetical protein